MIVLLGAAWMQDLAGNRGLYAVALVSGLTDVDAITLSSLRLFNLGQLGEHQAVTSIAIAFMANLAFKFGMVMFIGGKHLANMSPPASRGDRSGRAGRIGCVIIPPFSSKRQRHLMEAEKLNALSNQLQDLALRSAELRRYL